MKTKQPDHQSLENDSLCASTIEPCAGKLINEKQAQISHSLCMCFMIYVYHAQ
jgi:hypothetical protein